MDINDIRNSKLPSRIDRSIFNDISKSARHRSSFNNPNFMDNRRTKTTLSDKDLIFHDCREDSFNFLYHKQMTPKKTNCKSDKPLIPSILVRRKPEDKLKNPDRISLDRQNLTSCPILDNEDNVRLLNYQYNYISQIQHLEKLRKLILLDLYDNRIEKISGLDTLKSLRVLMLGRNRISKIEGLESLIRLDVLDLHANSIQIIENIDHLSDLRVLNLAGNNIVCLTNLKGLYSLSEINVRRNCIESVIDINSTNCPNLQRIFLNFNNLTKISDFSCLTSLSSLNELSMDNNPICSHTNFRCAIIFNFTQLELLDSKSISVEDRNRAKQIIGRVELGSKSSSGLSRHLLLNNRTPNNEQHSNNVQRFHSVMERRKGNMQISQRMLENWNQNGKNISPRLSIKSFSNASNSLYVTDSPNNNCIYTDLDQDTKSKFINSDKEFLSIEETMVKPSQHQHLESLQTSTKKFVITRPPSSTSLLPKPSEGSKPAIITNGNIPENNEVSQIPLNNGDYETQSSDKTNIEIVNEGEQIQFCSFAALRIFEDKEFWLSKSGLSTTVTTLLFRKIEFCDIEKIFFQIKARFPILKKIVFQACNIKCYIQINSLASLKRLEELIIEKSDNPITSFSLVRHYVIFRLAHLGLRSFNDIEITDCEFDAARRYFYSLAMIEPDQIIYLHLIGVINEVKKRELQQSMVNEQMTFISNLISSIPQTHSVNLDLVGKSGLLSGILISDLDDSSETASGNLCSSAIDGIMDSIRKQCDWEVEFHNRWVSCICQLIMSRLPPILGDRHEHMKQQFDRVLSKMPNGKSNPPVVASKKL